MDGVRLALDTIKELFRKYQRDNGQMMVAAIAFYVLLTFIPFTLLSIAILGYLVNLSSLDAHLIIYASKVIPEPFNDTVTAFLAKNMRSINIWKRFSGPLGLYFLFFFTSRLFAMLIPSFRVIFGKKVEGFFRKKGKEFFFTVIFSLLQAVIFFLTVILFVMATKVVGTISARQHPLEGTFYFYLFTFIDGACIFAMFYLLYYVLTPLKKGSVLLLSTTFLATVLWGAGKNLFKYYALQVGRFTVIFGAYGIFIAFLFWLYYSVFVFIVCAELQSVLLRRANRGLLPSSAPSPP